MPISSSSHPAGQIGKNQANDTDTGENRTRGTLRRKLSLPEVVAQSIGTIAPSGTPALVIPVVFATAGNGTWLAYLFATIALLFVSWSINQFARRSASPGALYLFAGLGLGRLFGVITGWSLLIAYLFTAAAVIGGSVNSVLVLAHQAGVIDHDDLLILVFSLAAIIGAWALAYRDITLSTRATLIIELAVVGLILVIVVGTILFKGPTVDVAQFSLEGVAPEQIRMGLVLAFFSFVGFESATTLGAETRAPLRVIPRSVVLSVVSVGLLFTLSAYGLVGAFHGLAPGLGDAEAPLTTVAHGLGLGGLGILIDIGVALSFFACTLGSINAGARVLYALSNHGLFHARAGNTHRLNATPHIAVTLLAVIAITLSLALTQTGHDLLETFSLLGTIATFGFLFSYLLVAAGAPVYLRRLGLLRFHHLVLSLVTVALLLIPLVGSVYPAPPWPFSVLPYLFLVLLGAGIGRFLYLRARAPDRLAALEADLLALPKEEGRP